VIEQAVDAIITRGGVWAALFILAVGMGIAAVVYLQRKVNAAHEQVIKCMADRVTDAKAMGDVIQAHGVVMTQQAAENAARTRASEAMGRAQELAAERVAHLTSRVESLAHEVRTLASNAASMREELLRSGKLSGNGVS
jgi:hypothetical protein